VVNVQATLVARVCPLIARIPAGISTEYSVAIGKRLSGWNRSVFAPSQRHLPGGSGVSLTAGCSASAESESAVTGTIGSLNVIVSCGAISTGPSGAWRSTLSGPFGGAAAGGPPAPGGGNGSLTVFPGRGAGIDLARSAKSFSSSGSCFSSGSRAASFFA
jgi:hypothetical protein